ERKTRAGLSTPSRRFEKITTDDRIRNNRMTSNEQRAALQRKIWDIANDVRGAVDGWDFKQYVLGTLFYRFISENFTDYIIGGDPAVNYAAMADDDPTIAAAQEDALKTKGYFIYPSQLFVNVAANASTNESLNTDLANIFKAIEASASGYPSEHDIKGLFADFDTTSNRLGNTVKDKNERLTKVLKRVTQKRMAELFGVGVPAVSKHLKNIFESNELDPDSVISILETTAEDGKKYQTQYYNLDAVISVGYRVNSAQATQFPIWATQLIKEYIIKGFAMDDERLKNGRYFGKDYFRELLERVRSIRASERRIYQQITDIFAECSIDYDPKSETTRLFYAHVQDKFHYAITGHTAAEIISLNADASKPLMGMTTYKNAPDGRVLKSDSLVAKN